MSNTRRWRGCRPAGGSVDRANHEGQFGKNIGVTNAPPLWPPHFLSQEFISQTCTQAKRPTCKTIHLGLVFYSKKPPWRLFIGDWLSAHGRATRRNTMQPRKRTGSHFTFRRGMSSKMPEGKNVQNSVEFAPLCGKMKGVVVVDTYFCLRTYT